MWFDGVRQPNTLYVASTSRGKDSTAMLRAIELLGFPLDAIVSVDIWFDENTPAELPPMVAFKDEYDRKVLDRFGIPVTMVCARKRERERRDDGDCFQRETYCDIFYGVLARGKFVGTIKGFPQTIGSWCKKLKIDICRCLLQTVEGSQGEGRQVRVPDRPGELVYGNSEGIGVEQKKSDPGDVRVSVPRVPMVYGGTEATDIRIPVREFPGRLVSQTEDGFSTMPQNEGQKINIVHYIGIAADEPARIARHMPAKDKVLPLVQIGWDEDICGLEAKYMDMLSPTYTDGYRDGCWFCHNQGVKQLRNLRKNYPDLWAKLMKLDLDSPVSFHPDGHTVHDFDRRFQLEDEGFVRADERFNWSMLDEELNYRWF